MWDKMKTINLKVEQNLKTWQEEMDDERIAFEIYNNIMLKKSISKAIVAQCLARIMEDCEDRDSLKSRMEKDKNLEYLLAAINYVTKQGS